MIRVAAYCRVSTNKEDQSNSFESQQRYFQAWIQHNPDWKLQEIYADEGLSGTDTKKRIQFNRMICAAREGKIDLIITKEVSRFARNTLDVLDYTRELRRYGIGVYFLIDNINTLDQDGELRLTLMSSIAQEESRKTSERIKWGQTRSMENGVVFGGSLLGYDVEDGKIRVNPEGAKVVRTIFHKYLDERKGSAVIARELQEEGIPSSRGNLHWSAATVLKILRNEKYCGDLVQKKTYTPDFLTHQKKYNRGAEEQVILRDHHEAIIRRDRWEAVQQELTRRSRKQSQSTAHGNRYQLSGKIKCGDCGSSFLARKKKSRTGQVYRVWRCSKATAEGKPHTDFQGHVLGCGIGRQIREDVAMDLLKQAVQSVQMDTEAIIANLTCIVCSAIQDSQDNISKEQQYWKRELEREEEKKQRALESFLDRDITKADVQFINQRCDVRILDIQQQLEKIQQGQTAAKELAEEIQQAIRSILQGECGEDGFYGRLLDHITVFQDGRTEVVLRFLPVRWIYVVHGRGKLTQGEVEAHYASSVPISVSNPLSSG